MPDGFLPVDKPGGPTSHDVVACVRKRFDTRRVGHTGTLDPFATGLLLVFVGRATRLSQFLSGLSKRYTGSIRLGVATDTDDLTGAPLRTSDEWERVTDSQIDEVMHDLTGRHGQQPPVYSAKKVGGRVAHRLARRGEVVTLSPQVVDVDRFQATRRDGADLEFEADVGTGVYVRALARDLGDRLGCGAHLRVLRRVSIGPFHVDQAVTLDAVVGGDVTLHAAADSVRHLEPFQLDETGLAAVRHGRVVEGPGQDGTVALFTGDDLVGIAHRTGGSLQPKVVLDG